jgi:5'(3')-deoxyribonucleotidase
MQPRRKIFVDLDGVIVDLVLPAMKHYDAYIPDETCFPDGYIWDCVGATNHIRERNSIGGVHFDPIPDDQFWEALDYNFWRSLKPYPLANSFIKWLATEGDVVFCTNALITSACNHARYDWLKFHYPKRSKGMIFTAQKELLAAQPRSILIDDSDRNVERFNAEAERTNSGAHAILLPRPWNTRGTAQPKGHAYDVVADELRTLDGRLVL